MTKDAKPVWFITGCSTGFGRDLVTLLLAQGYRVVATARDVSKLAALVAGQEDRALALALDVTDSKAIASAVAQAEARFGRISPAARSANRKSRLPTMPKPPVSAVSRPSRARASNRVTRCARPKPLSMSSPRRILPFISCSARPRWSLRARGWKARSMISIPGKKPRSAPIIPMLPEILNFYHMATFSLVVKTSKAISLLYVLK